MNTQHTPEPWAVTIYSGIIDGRGCRVAQAEPMPGQDKAEQTANAQLIAGAPDMLAALRYLVREATANGMLEVEPAIKQAIAAITKAKGGTK